jgi:ABC-type lipoprotein export system ATPase subunit/bifunctional DNA-binding transcriptional regulator/antitoxin component of YhaV-PrlF toxin-antitoxin module
MVAIVGPSGSGKTTLLNILGGLDHPTAGRVVVAGHDLGHLSAAALNRYRREGVGFVWQQPARNLLPYLSATENVLLPQVVAGRMTTPHPDWAEQLLEAVGLQDRRTHRLAELSSGEQQRLAIAIALANRPPLLLADEPTGNLDTATAREVWGIFRRINTLFDTTMVLVTHDEAIAAQSDRVVTIRDGQVSAEKRMEKGRHTPPSLPSEYVVLDSIGRLQVPPEYREQLGIGRLVKLELRDGTIVIHPVRDEDRTEIAVAPGEQKPRLPWLVRQARGVLYRPRTRLFTPAPAAPYFPQKEIRKGAAVRVVRLVRTYQSGGVSVSALRGVSMEVSPGTFAAVLGRSGSGKTTLLNLIGGLDRPTAGQVYLDGQEVSTLSEAELTRLRRHQVGCVFQSFALLPQLSAWDNVELVLRLAGMPRAKRVARTRQCLARVGLSAWANHRPYELSGGQQQRLAIARAMANRPALILADEPTGELDSASARQIMVLFRELTDKEGVTVIMATHDPLVEEYASVIYRLADGQIHQVRRKGDQ